MHSNHVTYQDRLDFIDRLLKDKFNLENTRIDTIAYDPDCIFTYNNFVYKVSLLHPLSEANNACSIQPGCVPIPAGATELILRLANPLAASMKSANRVENEVAIMTLAATALAPIFQPQVVPRIYGWAGNLSQDEVEQQGWIMQELMPGTPLDEKLDAMSLEDKKSIFSQIAQLLKGLQNVQLPASITQFGGLTFDSGGSIVSGPMTSTGIGPWPSYEASFKARLQLALQKSDDNAYIQGWGKNGLRDRLEAFADRGLPALFDKLESRDKKVLIHADFTPSNILFDPASGRITALIDYDFSCVLHPSYEFLRSFDGLGGQFRGWTGAEGRDQQKLKDAKLHGFPNPLPEDEEGVLSWAVAKAWEDELERVDCGRPKTIVGIEGIADVDGLLGSILPWRVTNEDILKEQTEEVIWKCRNENEVVLGEILGHVGF